MNKILLIYPPYERFKGSFCRDFPLGLGQLATILDLKDYEAMIYNADFNAKQAQEQHGVGSLTEKTKNQSLFVDNFNNKNFPIWQEANDRIEQFAPDMIGIYTTTSALPVVIRLLKIIKEKLPGCIIVLGGPHVTILPDEIMKIPEVEFALMGEADYTLPMLCDSLRDGNTDYKNIPGLAYRENGDVIINRSYDFIKDLDKLPMIRRDLILDEDSYPSYIIGGVIMGSRGCPYNCTFCASATIWRRQVRYRDPIKIVDELHYLRDRYEVFEFGFWDDTFTINKKNVFTFCDELNRRGVKFLWSCATRANLIDEPMVKKLKESGCVNVAIGIESGSNKVLKMMKKGITVDMVSNASKILKKHGIGMSATFIMGLPYETAQDIRMTIELIRNIRPDSVNLSTFFPYPGTEAYEEVVKLGLMPADFDWANNLELSHHSLANRFNPNIPDDEFRALMEEALAAATEVNRLTFRKKMRRYWNNKDRYLEDPIGLVKRVVARISR